MALSSFDWQIALSLGLLLAAALVAGGLASYVKLPKVTAYLLVGILLGPTILRQAEHLSATPPAGIESVSPEAPSGAAAEHLRGDPFEPLTKLAISLVLFNLGCHFPLARARRILGRALRLSAGELSATFLLVSGGILLLGQPWEAALLLGALALATAPATTILVLKETESEGPVTEYTNTLVALNNLVSIVLFELLFLGLQLIHDGSSGASTGALVSTAADLGSLGQDLVGSIVLGIAGGLVVSYAFSLVSGGRRLVLLLAVILPLLAICELRGMPYLLTFLAMGAMVANSSDQTRAILGELDQLTGLLCVVFFVAHGSELDLAKLGQAGVVGLAYVVLRFAGKYFGTRWAARRVDEQPAVQVWLGATLTAQAGAAIALSAIAVAQTESLGGPLHQICRDVQIVILGTVVVFELVGPILIRQAVLRAGEVPLAHAIRPPGSGLVEQGRIVWNRLLIAVGKNPFQGRSSHDLTVRELMRKVPVSISQSATFDEVIAQIEHSRDHTFPVVGPGDELLGVIRYRELSTVLFEPALGSLVRAADVTTAARHVLRPDDSAQRAFGLFEKCKDDCLPVVTEDAPRRLVGIVRRRDVLRLLIRGQRTN